ncbi:MAG: hypothetical protein IT320_04315 [Anaerolineae bacterium]|nr:hypothetical protein [Anaerolineae bacterium]
MDISSHIPRLHWVIVGGTLCDVSTFKELAPRDRPKAYCPVCEQPVTLKLGKQRVHHFAHRPEDVCSATEPETALHLNCKYHIYQQLQSAKEVYASISCRDCGTRKPMMWKQDWDTVEVEHKMDSLRPDIAILQDGKVIGAIEIFVTHAVNEEKVQQLQNQGIDWIEIRGAEEIYEEPGAWTIEKPLVPYRQHPSLPTWTCPNCQRIQDQEDRERRNRAEIEIMYARMIDFYYPSGKKYREVYYVKRAIKNGELKRIWIENEKRQIIATESALITKESRQRLNETFKQKLRGLEQKADIVDHEMDWTPWQPGRRFVARDINNFPFRYVWLEDLRQWVFRPHLTWKQLG